MKFLLYIISFNLFIASINPAGLSSGFGRGTAFAGVASGQFFYGDINPANFSFATEVITGAYAAPSQSSYATERSFPLNNVTGAFFIIPVKKFTLYSEGFGSYEIADNSPQINSLQFSGAGVGLSYALTPNFYLGVFTSSASVNSTNYLDASTGFIYSFNINKKILYNFGIYKVQAGASFKLNPWAIGQNFDLGTLYPGVTIQLWQSRPVQFFYDNAVSVYGEFREISFHNGFRLTIYELLEFNGGFKGADFFRYNYGYTGASLRIPMHFVELNLASSYSTFSYDKISGNPISEISAGLYLQYNISKFSLFSKSDDKLITIFEPEETITPDGDGHDDVLTIHLGHFESNMVKDWNMVVEDDNSETVSVYQPDHTNQEGGLLPFPKKLSWQGLDANGTKLSDGSYNFTLLAIMPNGDKRKWRLGSIKLDSHKPAFNVVVTQKNHFMSKEKPFTVLLNDNMTDMQSYKIQFIDVRGKTAFEKEIPSEGERTSFSWNGYLRDNQTIDTGSYDLLVTAIDKAGAERKVKIENIRFSKTENEASMAIPFSVFSPNGDRKRDALPMSLNFKKRDSVKTWQVDVISLQLKSNVRSFTGKNLLPEKLIWKGEDDNEKPLPNGSYRLMLKIQDNDQKLYESLQYDAIIDRDPPFITLQSEQLVFTPDSDGDLDNFQLDINTHEQTTILAYKLIFRSSTGKLVKQVSEKGSLPAVYRWNGIQDNNLVVDSLESFTVVAEALDAAGNIGRSNLLNFESGLIIKKNVSELSIGSNEISLNFPNILFPRRQFIPMTQSYRVLDKLVEYLKSKPDLHITVVGHTDGRGSAEYNLELSERRALYIKGYLVKKGISNERLSSQGMGKAKPLVKEINDDYRAKNRRVEFVLQTRVKGTE